MSHLLNREASPEERTGLTILREYHVLWLYGGGAPDTSGLLTELRHIETDTRLSLCLIINDISLVHHDHGPEHLLHGAIIDAPLVSLVDNIPIFVHDTETLQFIE